MSEIRLGPFTGGMNNRQPDHALPDGTLRNAVNARIDNSGIVSRRSGMSLVYSGMNINSGFDCPAGVLFREGNSIMRLNSDDTSDELFNGSFGEYCTFEYLNDVIYFSDGTLTKKIHSDWSVTEWGMEQPASPVIYGVSGSYGAGTYLAAVTYVDADGVESGASDIVSASLGADTGIVFDNIPTTTDPHVAGVRLYLSTANGTVMYQVAEVSPGVASYTILSGAYDEGKLIETEFVSKPLPGRIIRAFNGRLYIADDTGLVWFTNSLSYDHMNESENFLQFPDPVTVMEPVQDGIWFAYGNKTDFYFGSGPDDFSPKRKFEYGAVFGTGRKVQNSNNVMWYSNRGVIVAGSGAEAQNLQEKNVATDTALSGATMIKEEDGIRQFITSLSDPTVSKLAARDFINAEIIRKG